MREIKLINKAIKKLDLNLRGLIVFTEAASGHYRWTPIIAALAGAKRVYAVAKDSKYGKKEDIKKEINLIAKKLEEDKKIKIVFNKNDINKADIITNLGFVRPIDRKLISRMKPTAVIPLMYEIWEYRESDLDLKECHKKGIPVLGTNEQDKRIKILDYLGCLAQKKIYELGYEFFNNNIAIIGKDIFGEKIFTALRKQNKTIFIYGTGEIKHFLSKASNFDIVVLANHSENNKNLLNKKILRRLKRLNPDMSFIQVAGGLIDYNATKKIGFKISPNFVVKAGTMGYTLAELSPKPVIDLHTAGLKVGEIMAKLQINGYSYENTLKTAIQNKLVTGFKKSKIVQ